MKTTIEISKTALIHNVHSLKARVIGKDIMAVVKANAYGHGIAQIVPILAENGINWFAVDNIDEALEVRSFTDAHILVLGYVPFEQLSVAAKSDISLTVYNNQTVDHLAKLPGKTKVHIKVETGMNRQGIKNEELEKLTGAIEKSPHIILEGISTHFADPENLDVTHQQVETFKAYTQEINAPFVHCGASIASLTMPDIPGNLARIGRAMYGFLDKFEAVLSFKSIVAQIKHIKKGEYVGYGRAWQADTNTRIAIIPIGYADGFDRRLSNKGHVLIHGEYANVVGRVAMNMIAVDISKIADVKIEDEVVIIGTQGSKSISANDIGDMLDTVGHEVLSRLNPNIHKIII